MNSLDIHLPKQNMIILEDRYIELLLFVKNIDCYADIKDLKDDAKELLKEINE